MALLLRNLPRHVHLIVSSREIPPFPLAWLRARGGYAEIRAEDLRFNRAEVEELQTRLLGEADDDVSQMLMDRTEGSHPPGSCSILTSSCKLGDLRASVPQPGSWANTMPRHFCWKRLWPGSRLSSNASFSMAPFSRSSAAHSATPS